MTSKSGAWRYIGKWDVFCHFCQRGGSLGLASEKSRVSLYTADQLLDRDDCESSAFDFSPHKAAHRRVEAMRQGPRIFSLVILPHTSLICLQQRLDG